jgi:hypothetical protein
LPDSESLRPARVELFAGRLDLAEVGNDAKVVAVPFCSGPRLRPGTIGLT